MDPAISKGRKPDDTVPDPDVERAGFSELPPATEEELAEGITLHGEGRYVELRNGWPLELRIGDSTVFRVAESEEFGESVVFLTTPDEPGNRARAEKFHRISHDHEMVVGRAVDNPGMSLPDTVSKYHFGVRRTDTGVNVRDLESRNGTFLRTVRAE